jgi:hypothetical protein
MTKAISHRNFSQKHKNEELHFWCFLLEISRDHLTDSEAVCFRRCVCFCKSRVLARAEVP